MSHDERTCDVAIVGAGPTGLMLANLLGQAGHRVQLFEERDQLIDYPRGVGLDDEAMRIAQAAGIAERIVPHMVPNQGVSYVTASGRTLATFRPNVHVFGWPRKNGFIQPWVDAEMHRSLARFPNTEAQFSSQVESWQQDDDGVAITVATPEGQQRWRAQYLVGCDGGRSMVRAGMGVSFEGHSEPSSWLVMDINNDPVGTPNVSVVCDARRPYVSLGLPHGIRRFEFMLLENETADWAEGPGTRKLLEHVVTDPDTIELIRSRVYTHHSRVAASFARSRVMIAGDAAHLMPVWQGQGYNTGIRDAGNLAWKLDLVLRRQAAPKLLETYDTERRPHAHSMVELSRWSGKYLGVRSRAGAAVRDWLTLSAAVVPAFRDYFLQMKFKPMPTFTHGAVTRDGANKRSPVGTLFIQPDVTVDGHSAKLDNVIGNSFAILRWGVSASHALDESELSAWRANGVKLLTVVPEQQLDQATTVDGEILIGDHTGALREWFDTHPVGVVFLRPDHIVGGACVSQQASRTSAELRAAIGLTETERTNNVG